MAEFLTTKGVSHHIDDIIKRANKDLWILSPYLQISKLYIDRLRELDKKEIPIFIIYREFRNQDIAQKQKDLLTPLKYCSTLVCKELHAKCYKNDNDIVVTSMNLFEFSENNNREMGIWINRQNDPVMFEDAVAEIKSIYAISDPDTETIKKNKLVESQNKIAESNGSAYGTLNPIPHQGDKGICPKCGKALVQRVGKREGMHKGEVFLGCSGFPDCRYKLTR